MRLQYVALGENAEIVVHTTDSTQYLYISNHVKSLVYTHRNFPLREHYKVCKNANLYFRDIGEDEDIDKHGYPLIKFFSSWEQHKPLITIFQEKLDLVIENLPE